MSLPAGARLGPYEVVALLGAGGMGEVYRAHDARLGRDVAIKVLPAALAADPERLKRFEREARSASSLNHPNIVTIYDIGSDGGVSYIAMELVKGDPLRTELVRGAVPVKRLLQIGAEIAEGLGKAHAAGIVHRDLKPENVMLTEDDHVKILDFGLAKLTMAEESGAQATMAPTMSGETAEGIILGTVGYMSPEQAVGGTVDYRSDQFSLGSILYEMATGRRAFQRASAPQTLTAIIQDDPEPIATLNPRIPLPARWLIERCLAKAPRDRYASTEDLARDLSTVRDRLSEATSGSGIVSEPPASVRRRRWWIPAAITTVLFVAAAFEGWRLRNSGFFWRSPLAGARFTRFTDWDGAERDGAISGDGKFVSFLSDRSGVFDAWIGQVGGSDFLNLSKGRFPELVNTSVRTVGFSEDDTQVWLLDVPQRMLWLVPTMGGEPRPFLRNGVSVTWSHDRSRVLYHTSALGDPIFIADRNGLNPRQIYIGAPGIHNHYPAWSPDGRFIYFVSGIPPLDMDLWRIGSAGGAAERLTHHRSNVGFPVLLDDRTVVYTASEDDGSSRLYSIDVERREPHRVTLGLEEYLTVGASADGRRLVTTAANPTRTLWTMPILDRVTHEGDLVPFPTSRTHVGSPRFGPDFLLYLSSRGGPQGLWRFKDGSETELWSGSEGGISYAPAVSRDGSHVAFVVRRNGRGVLHVLASDDNTARPLAESLDVRDTPSWSPDGKWIAVAARVGDASPLFKVPVQGGGAPVHLADGMLSDPAWSPQGSYILYLDSSQGGPTVTIRAVTPDGHPPNLPELPKVSYLGNRYRFTADGKSLVIMKGLLWSQELWICDMATGNLRQLTELGPQSMIKSFDVSPDGSKIVLERYRENSDIVLIDLPPR